MGTGSLAGADAAGLLGALHRLRSVLAKLKGELELAELDGVQPGATARAAIEEALAALSAAEHEALARRQRVLVADDDKRLAVLTARQLSREGFAVSSVSTVDELRDAIAGSSCVVLDLSMVERAGAEVMEAVRAARPVVLSGAVDSGSRARAEALGAFVSLLKPVDGATLAAAVRRRMEAEGL